MNTPRIKTQLPHVYLQLNSRGYAELAVEDMYFFANKGPVFGLYELVMTFPDINLRSGTHFPFEDISTYQFDKPRGLYAGGDYNR